MPPKSAAFHRIAREVLGPPLAELGFKRPRDVGLGGWRRDEPSGSCVLWTQLSHSNYGDDPAGYQFVVELQWGRAQVDGWGHHRSRLYQLLTEVERVEHQEIHNEVIAKTRPNPDVLAFLASQDVSVDVERYRAGFEARPQPFDLSDDVWFPYTDEFDVRRWMAFVAAVLPGTIERLRAIASEG